MRERCVQVLVGKTEGKRLIYDVGADGRIIIKLIFKNLILGRGMKLCASGQRQVLCAFDCDKGNWCYIKRREFLD